MSSSRLLVRWALALAVLVTSNATEADLSMHVADEHNGAKSAGRERGGAVPSSEEEFFKSLPSAEEARETLFYLTSEPHMAGTPGDLKTAMYMKQRFVEAGIPKDRIAKRAMTRALCLSLIM